MSHLDCPPLAKVRLDVPLSIPSFYKTRFKTGFYPLQGTFGTLITEILSLNL